MTYLFSIVVFLVIFSLLILVHEFGHFFAARRAGVKVEEFGLGLPPRAKKLWKDKKGTLFSLNWIPFGGFVRMFGEDSEDEKMRYQEGSFSSKGVGQRTNIILGGVLMNFLLGYLLLVLLLTVGTKPFVATAEDFDYYRQQGIIVADDRVAVVGFSEDSPGKKAGLQENDVIKSIDGKTTSKAQDVLDLTKPKANQSVSMGIRREEKDLVLTIPVNVEGKMGVVISNAPLIKEVKEISFPFSQAVIQAGYETGRLSLLTMQMFIKVIFDLFTKAELSPQVSGPVGIAQITHQATQQGSIWEILKLVALLSISLGAINVLPIPALDGGRFLSIVFEVVARKRPNALWEARIHAFGFVILLILIVAVTYNDIVKLFSQP